MVYCKRLTLHRSSEAVENDSDADEEEEAARSFEVRFKSGAIGGRMLGAARPRCNTDIREDDKSLSFTG